MTALDDTGFSTMVAHIAQLAGTLGQVSSQIREIGSTVKELSERVDRQPEETRAVAAEVDRSAHAQLPQAGMDTPLKGPPPPPERIELPMQHKPPYAPEPVFTPKPNQSRWQPRWQPRLPVSSRVWKPFTPTLEDPIAGSRLITQTVGATTRMPDRTHLCDLR
eukprot:4920578-Pleurochrysis_carterae.AAC.1